MNRWLRKLSSPLAVLLILCLLGSSGSAFAAQENFAIEKPIQIKPIEIKPSQPEQTVSQQILEDYLALLQAQSPHRDWKLEDIAIMADYGQFHGTQVILIKPIHAIGTCDIRNLTVGGVTFTFNSGTDIQFFLAWKDRTFYSIAEAYQLGLLTRADLLEIQQLRGGATPRKNVYFDVPADAWYYDAVCYVDENGLMQGTETGKFSPHREMSRAMLVTVLWRQAGCPKAEKAPFTDVPEKAWYADAVAWAAENQIVNGMGNGRFAPNASLTREQLATILYRQSGAQDAAPALGDQFADKDAISSWALPAMRWAVSKQILEGSISSDQSARLLNPKAAATRAQSAAILMRALNRTELPSSTPRDLTSGFSSQLTQTPALEEFQCDAIADFSVNLFRASMREEGNSVMSPLSVLNALALAANGARGRTLEQLEAAFGMDRMQTNRALLALQDGTKDKFATVNIANSIWVRDGFSIQEEFLQRNADYLHADAFQLPFDKGAVDSMNHWVSENTDQMIPRIVNSLPRDAFVTFINAILFKSDWANCYSGTIERPFYPAEGAPQTAEMLCSLERSYIHDDCADGFLKPFRGSQYAFAVIVPKETVSLDAYLAGLDGSSLREMLKNASPALVDAQMPKFKASFEIPLCQALSVLGIQDALLADAADFSDIADGIFFSNAFHKAVIDVNESGVSAAAATTINKEAHMPDSPRITITADRPYLYLIVDTQTNLPLFIGTAVCMENP